MTLREATPAEILADSTVQLYIRQGWTHKFRRFSTEYVSLRAKNGIAARRYSRAKIQVVEGVPFVRWQGELRQLTADLSEIEGHTYITDFRIKSEYLK